MAPRESGNTEKVQVFFSPKTLSQLKQEAQKKGISVSAMVRMIVLEYFAKK